MDILWMVLSLVFFFALFMTAASVFTPKTAWFFKEKTKMRGAMLWLGVGLATAIIVSVFAPPVDMSDIVAATDSPAVSAQATPLEWIELEKTVDKMPATGRDRLSVAIAPAAEQKDADQKQLAATVKAAAMQYQKQSGLPVVNMNLVCQRLR